MEGDQCFGKYPHSSKWENVLTIIIMYQLKMYNYLNGNCSKLKQ